MGCPPVRKIIHSLKLVDYLHVQADNPWYNNYLFFYRTALPVNGWNDANALNDIFFCHIGTFGKVLGSVVYPEANRTKLHCRYENACEIGLNYFYHTLLSINGCIDANVLDDIFSVISRCFPVLNKY